MGSDVKEQTAEERLEGCIFVNSFSVVCDSARSNSYGSKHLWMFHKSCILIDTSTLSVYFQFDLSL